MARAGRLYYAIVNKGTGKIDHNCSQCSVHDVNILIGLPTAEASHSVIRLTLTDYGLMTEFDQSTGRLRHKWNKGQGKPVEDK